MASQRDLADQLLGRAREDEVAARAMLDISAVTDAIVGFHAQQAVEKALKAVLAIHEVEFPFTHDLAGLAELCEAEGAVLPPSLADIDQLTPFGVRLRYGALDDMVPVERAVALQWAELTISWASDVIDAVA
jgi:HEPN domain-containing protein